MKVESFGIVEVPGGWQFRCRPSQSLLEAMASTGKGSVPNACQDGGCGLCKVQVLSGAFECGSMSGRHVTPEARKRGQVLACRIFPLSDMTLKRSQLTHNKFKNEVVP